MSFPLMPAILNAVSVPRVVSFLGVGQNGLSISNLVLPAAAKRMIVVQAACGMSYSSSQATSVTVTPNTGSPVSLTKLHSAVKNVGIYAYNSMWVGFIPTGASCIISAAFVETLGYAAVAAWVVSGIDTLTPNTVTGSTGNLTSPTTLATAPAGSLALATISYAFSADIPSMSLAYNWAYPGYGSNTRRGWSLLSPASATPIVIQSSGPVDGPCSLLIWN